MKEEKVVWREEKRYLRKPSGVREPEQFQRRINEYYQSLPQGSDSQEGVLQRMQEAPQRLKDISHILEERSEQSDKKTSFGARDYLINFNGNLDSLESVFGTEPMGLRDAMHKLREYILQKDLLYKP
ncbi:MAG: hypothetical protein Q8R37_04695 [Nanoarchaeota archaeon]|nr:hypothetical protein [Nanoarchaeota archaeon]